MSAPRLLCSFGRHVRGSYLKSNALMTRALPQALADFGPGMGPRLGARMSSVTTAGEPMETKGAADAAAAAPRPPPKNNVAQDFTYRMEVLLEGTRGRTMPDEAKVERAAGVLELWEEMKTKGGKPNPRAYKSLVSALSLKGDTAAALEVPTQMRESGLPVTLPMYHHILDSFKGMGAVEEAARAMEHLKSAGLTPDVKIFNSMIVIAGRGKQLPQALSVLQDMQKLSVKPNISTYAGLIGASCQMDDATRGFEFLCEMEGNQMFPLPHVYKTLLISALQGGHVEAALHCFKALQRSQGLAPSTDSLTPRTLINMAHLLSRAKKHSELEDVAAALIDKGLKVPWRALDSLLEHYSEHGNLADAFKTVGTLMGEGRQLRRTGVKALVDACSMSADHVDQAYYTALKMQENGQQVHIECLNSIIHACAKLGDVDRAFATFVEVEKAFQQQPNLGTFNALLSLCVRANLGPSALRIMDEMEKREIAPDHVSHSFLLRVHLRQDKLDDSLRIFDGLLERREHPSGDACVALMKACHSQEQFHRVGQIYQWMQANNAFIAQSIHTLAKPHARLTYPPATAALPEEPATSQTD